MMVRFLLACAAVCGVLTLTACSPLTAVNAVSPDGGARATTAIRYGDAPRNMLDVYMPPARPAGAGPAPVIVFFYGGNWVSGARGDYAFVGRALADRGFVVVIPDYRLYPAVRYPAFLEDAARAVAWTERSIGQYGGDARDVVLMGHSAGAYNAAMLALDARWLGHEGFSPASLRGWIGLAGPYDFLPIDNPTTRPVFDYPNTRPESQPIEHVGAGAPPALLIAPRGDKTVNPVRNTGGLAARLRASNVKVEELYYDRVGHATLVASLSPSLRFLAPTLDAVTAFVRAGADKGRIGSGTGSVAAGADLNSAGSDRRTSGPAR